MSFSGTYTPLGLNVIGSLSEGTGLTINPTVAALQGTWTPSAYTPGTVTASTVLGSLSDKIKSVYDDVVSSTITPDVYRTMLDIGSSVCPALGNSRPPSFKPSYPGAGSWSASSLVSDFYPPKGYPTDGTYSYIYQTRGDYAWITGWPGKNSWQQPTDTYSAAYLPAPGESLTDYDEYFSRGFVATVARQAYYEMYSDQFTQYNNIVNVFGQVDAFKNSKNAEIASFVNTKSFMTGLYSNINDVATSDISGVTQSFKVWGSDLKDAGRAMYLPDIDKFGLPSALLRNLQRNNVVTDAVKLALLYNDLTISELDEILGNSYTPTPTQERQIYAAFKLISGDDLHSTSTGIMYGLNCKTKGIETLTDLLDLRKLFPNSYESLTIPKYNLGEGSAKIYDFIYVGGGVNGRIENWGTYLDGILPAALSISCGAFSMSMRQIKNISSMEIEKFSQVVTNLELPNLGLALINTGDGVPGSVEIANNILSKIANGSGANNSYRMCDFYGSASGFPYTEYFKMAEVLIKQLTTPTLISIYSNLPVTTDAEVESLVDAANLEISAIYANNPQLCEQLNYYWSLIGEQLMIEQRAIPMAIADAASVMELMTADDFSAFVGRVEQYAQETTAGESATILEAISDMATVGGQSLVAMMRESRNAARLGLAGGDLQNDVPTDIDTCSASAVATVTDGAITQVTVTSRSNGYTSANPPKITVYPVGHGAILNAILASDGSVSSINIVNGGSGFSHAEISISPPPQCQPENPPQQTYADTAYSQLVPTNLVSSAAASPTVAEAIDMVTTCNCACWD